MTKLVPSIQSTLFDSFMEVCIVDDSGFYPEGFVTIDGHQLLATQMINQLDGRPGIGSDIVMMFMLHGQSSDYRIQLLRDAILVDVWERGLSLDDMKRFSFMGYEGCVDAFKEYVRETVLPDCLAVQGGESCIEG
jgi:hypothetical protein